MTSTNGPASLFLAVTGVALALLAAGPTEGQPPERRRGTLSVFDKGHVWDVVRDGDRFVALRFRRGDGVPLATSR